MKFTPTVKLDSDVILEISENLRKYQPGQWVQVGKTRGRIYSIAKVESLSGIFFTGAFSENLEKYGLKIAGYNTNGNPVYNWKIRDNRLALKDLMSIDSPIWFYGKVSEAKQGKVTVRNLETSWGKFLTEHHSFDTSRELTIARDWKVGDKVSFKGMVKSKQYPLEVRYFIQPTDKFLVF